MVTVSQRIGRRRGVNDLVTLNPWPKFLTRTVWPRAWRGRASPIRSLPKKGCHTATDQAAEIHKLRHGERKLTVQWAKRLASKLDCTWQELIEGPAEPEDPQRAALFTAYNSLDQRDRDTLLRVAESLRRDDPPVTPIPHQERPPPPRPRSGGSVIENSNAGDCAKVVRWPGATA